MPKRLSKILTLLLAVAACIAAAGCATRFSWSNPIANYTPNGKGLRDPFILKEGKYWYMTGTMSPYGNDDGIFVLDIDPKTGAATEIKGPTWGKRSVKTGR